MGMPLTPESSIIKLAPYFPISDHEGTFNSFPSMWAQQKVDYSCSINVDPIQVERQTLLP